MDMSLCKKLLPMKINFEFSPTRQWICQLCHIEYNIALSLLDLTGKVIQQIWLLDKYVSKTIYSYKSKRYVVAKYWHLKAVFTVKLVLVADVLPLQ